MSARSAHEPRVPIVVATANPDKLVEIKAIVGPVLDQHVELVARPSTIPDIEETGDSLEENARLKATAISRATGLAAMADDTGLEVSALGGAPGIFSARYAGEGATYSENVDKLLSALDGTHDRTARFVTVAVCVFPDGTEVVARGEVNGLIAPSRQGEGGFGYDPVFVPKERAPLSFAEIGAEGKHAISHRGRAFRSLCSMVMEKIEAES